MKNLKYIFTLVVILSLPQTNLFSQTDEESPKIDVVYEVSCMGEPFYIAKSEDQFAIMGTDWNPITAFEYDKIEMLDSRLLYALKGKRSSLYNCKGQKIIDQSFHKVHIYSDQALQGKYFVTNALNKIGVINENGEILIPIEYDRIDPLSIHQYLYAESNGTKHYYDYSGKRLVR